VALFFPEDLGMIRRSFITFRTLELSEISNDGCLETIFWKVGGRGHVIALEGGLE